jgi:sirohydrochlorin ferrochelatase
MTTVTFDTAAGIRHLREHGFTEEQAEAIVQTLREAQAELVSREYLSSEIKVLERDLKLWTGKLAALTVTLTSVIVVVLEKVLK